MTGDWVTLTVEEIKADTRAALAMGPFGSRITTDNFVECGVPVIRGCNLNGERFLDQEFVFVTEQKADELRASNAFPGDLVFTHRGTIGQVGIIPLSSRYPRYVVSQSQMKLTCDTKKVDPLYVFYFFRSPYGQHALLANTSTTGVPAISRPLTSLRGISVPIPSLPEQRAIARILGSLDDKIELNRKMNETLEAMARALFKSWFVDFDPVRAKAEGRRPYGMDDATAALFPDSFEESELGEIPEGWKVVPLPEVIEVNPTRRLAKGQAAPYLDMQNMPTSGHRPAGWISRPFGSGTKFINGDTLLARITPCLENGKTAFVDFLQPGEVGWGSTEYIILRPKPSLPAEYGYFLARSESLRDFAIQNMTGSSGRQRVPPDCFNNYLVVVPDKAIGERFGQLVGPLMSRIKSDSQQSSSLTEMRDALLPKLLSGEIRVKEAERVVEVTL
ncbi:MAG: restriction endonuclease subunit S [Chloroflexi bacterium]|nr:restriction endonuclease subunit S [Chloroflexota bacterium]